MNVRSTNMNTKQEILTATVDILAQEGYAGTSMRKVAAAIGREPSIIYAHFSDKEDLLRATRMHITMYLDNVQKYTPSADAHTLLQETIRFQLKHRKRIVALLQYFMAARHDFPLSAGGYVPERAYAHMTKVIEAGIAEGRYEQGDVGFKAKLTTHLTNGFLMEYFDRPLNHEALQHLTGQLTKYVERVLLPRSNDQ